MDDWSTLFADGSEPTADARAYPPFAELRAKYQELRDRNLQILASLSDADFDKPTVKPLKGREKEFATFGKSFLTLALHQLAHRGHVTDARRAAKLVAA